MKDENLKAEKRLSDVEKTVERIKQLILECAHEIDPFFSERKRRSEMHVRQQQLSKDMQHAYSNSKITWFIP